MRTLMTVWGEHLDRGSVLREYPRPQMKRENYVNLNGEWDYAITPADCRPSGWDGVILVPFSPEAPLSGVQRTLLPGQALWYRRDLDIERHEGRRWLLHIGAADQKAQVYVNGQKVCEHIGGYTAFEADITDTLTDRNELIVRVTDDTDSCQLSRGKQKTKRGGIWYTPQSGIWQTVWLEEVPELYIRSLRLTPGFDERVLRWSVEAAEMRPVSVRVLCAGDVIAEQTCCMEGCLRIPDEYYHEWSPESPYLYDVEISMDEDTVLSYFALRKFGTGHDEHGKPCLMLNNRPYYHHGVLDQGYWPDGLYTAPSDEALVYDIQLMKDMGFNMLRKHIKVEPLRWYYHCDRLGMLVWQDMMSGGGSYSALTVTAPLFTGIHISDHNYRKFARTDESARAHYYAELKEMVRQLYNCPCIAMWVPFNEGWGQFDAEKAVSVIREIDMTRTIDHASGWHDQKIGQIQSLHVYFRPYRFKPDRLGRAVILSEFGGYSLPVTEHVQNDRHFGYRSFRTQDGLSDAVAELYETQILPAKEKGLAASVYTQLSDVEDEVNGFVTYDRKAVKIPKSTMREITLRLKTK